LFVKPLYDLGICVPSMPEVWAQPRHLAETDKFSAQNLLLATMWRFRKICPLVMDGLNRWGCDAKLFEENGIGCFLAVSLLMTKQKDLSRFNCTGYKVEPLSSRIWWLVRAIGRDA